MITDSSLADKIFEICKFVYQGKRGIYLEAGANDGISYSNTLRLEKELGWTGILVEPGVPAYDLLQQNRPGNLNFNFALTESESQKLLAGTFSSGSLLSSAHSELRYRDIAKLTHKFRGVARLRAFMKLRPRVTLIEIEAQTLDRVTDLSGHSKIDLLSLDVEGYEFNALLGLKRHRPEIIVVETRSHNVWEINTLLLSRGYVLLGDISAVLTGMEIPEHADLVWVDSNNSQKLNLVAEAVALLRQRN